MTSSVSVGRYSFSGHALRLSVKQCLENSNQTLQNKPACRHPQLNPDQHFIDWKIKSMNINHWSMWINIVINTLSLKIFWGLYLSLILSPFNSWQPIMKFINDQYEQYLQEEINIDRKRRIPDSRVHCCIYFIPPTGHWLVNVLKNDLKQICIYPNTHMKISTLWIPLKGLCWIYTSMSSN